MSHRATDQPKGVAPGAARLAQRGSHVGAPAAGPAALPARAALGKCERDPAHHRRNREQLGIGEIREVLAREPLDGRAEQWLIDLFLRLVAAGFFPGASFSGLVERRRVLPGSPGCAGEQMLGRPFRQAAETGQIRLVVGVAGFREPSKNLLKDGAEDQRVVLARDHRGHSAEIKLARRSGPRDGDGRGEPFAPGRAHR
jgi:hypothetical protein